MSRETIHRKAELLVTSALVEEIPQDAAASLDETDLQSIVEVILNILNLIRRLRGV